MMLPTKQRSATSAHGRAAGKRSTPVSEAKPRFCAVIKSEGQDAPERINKS